MTTFTPLDCLTAGAERGDRAQVVRGMGAGLVDSGLLPLWRAVRVLAR